MNMCAVQSGHAALFSLYGLCLMSYFPSMWEARHYRRLAASRDTLICIDSRRKEANEKLIKRKYVERLGFYCTHRDLSEICNVIRLLRPARGYANMT